MRNSRNSPPPVYRPSQPATPAPPPVYRPPAVGHPAQPALAKTGQQPRTPVTGAPPQKAPVFAPVPRLNVQHSSARQVAQRAVFGRAPAPPRFVQPRRGQSVQRIAYADLAKQLTGSELKTFNSWLADLNVINQGRLGTDTMEFTRDLFLNAYGTADDVRNQMALYSGRVAAESSFGGAQLDAVIDEIWNALRNSAIVPAGSKPARPLIASSIAVLNEGAFNRAHFQSTVAANPTIASDRLGITDARKVTQVEGFEHNGAIALRQGQVNSHIAVHEMLHKLGDGGVAAQLGKVLNEALTEHLARAVCDGAGIPKSDLYYQAERALLTTIGQVLHWNLDLYKRAYFEDPSAISSVLRLQLGDDGYADFVAKKLPAEASVAFRDGSQRQRKRLNLRTAVQAGLAAYNGRWKFNVSAASAHAVGRLNALINRLEILESIVRYYVQPATLAPPGGLNLGSKLNTDSSLYADLSGAFNNWAVANP
jgi:hypothetical protein